MMPKPIYIAAPGHSRDGPVGRVHHPWCDAGGDGCLSGGLMSEIQKPWTPGDWNISPHCDTLVEADTRNVASAGGYQSNVNPDAVLAENKANARLIAAAPELVERLEEFVAAEESFQDATPNVRDYEDPLTDACKSAKALLAKVYGGES